MNTPWGPAQTVKQIAAGCWWITTAGHGGMKLDVKLYPMPAAVLARPFVHRVKVMDGAGTTVYLLLEEDCEWAWAIEQHPGLAVPMAPLFGLTPERVRADAARMVAWMNERAGVAPTVPS